MSEAASPLPQSVSTLCSRALAQCMPDAMPCPGKGGGRSNPTSQPHPTWPKVTSATLLAKLRVDTLSPYELASGLMCMNIITLRNKRAGARVIWALQVGSETKRKPCSIRASQRGPPPHLGLAAKGVLQQLSQLGVAEGNLRGGGGHWGRTRSVLLDWIGGQLSRTGSAAERRRLSPNPAAMSAPRAPRGTSQGGGARRRGPRRPRRLTWLLCAASAVITSPSADRLLLMCCASTSRSPAASDFATRSLPARSMRCRQPWLRLPVTR